MFRSFWWHDQKSLKECKAIKDSFGNAAAAAFPKILNFFFFN